jgi:hypothetical protein
MEKHAPIYTIEKDLFMANKKHLDGYVFWQDNNNQTVNVKMVAPQKEIRKFLEEKADLIDSKPNENRR